MGGGRGFSTESENRREIQDPFLYPKLISSRAYREWYSLAPFSHPHPASPTILHSLFPSYSLTYLPSLTPSYSISSTPPTPHATTLGGESPSQLHTRVATALSRIISYADIESGAEEVAILVCTHAATMIAAGRVLTGVMPRDINEPDFRAYTCGLSRFVRRSRRESGGEDESALKMVESTGERMLSNATWMNGKGVAGGWDCLLDSDCTHLPGGEERGWYVLIHSFSRLTPFRSVFFDSWTRDLIIQVVLGQNPFISDLMSPSATLGALETQEPNTLTTTSIFAECCILLL